MVFPDGGWLTADSFTETSPKPFRYKDTLKRNPKFSAPGHGKRRGTQLDTRSGWVPRQRHETASKPVTAWMSLVLIPAKT